MLRLAVAVIAALLVTAAPASAGTFVGNPGDRETRAILYNGHAGLGLNVPDVTAIPH